MKRILFLITFVLASCAYSFAQSSDSLQTIVTFEGKVYTGQIFENVKDSIVKIRVASGYVYAIPYRSIRSIQYAADAKPDTLAADYKPNLSFTSNNSSLPYRLQAKRTKGIVLTSVGGGLLAIGSILIAASPNGIQTVNRPGYAGVNFRGSAAAGFITILAGIPTFIVGAIQLSIAQKRIRNYKLAQEHSMRDYKER